MSCDILIVGGGIIGLMSALELTKNHSSITIIDQGEIGQEASWAAGGILSPLHPWHADISVNRLSHWSQDQYPQILDTLHQSTGVDSEWVQNGMLLLDSDEIETAQNWGRKFNRPVELIDPDPLSQLEPELNPTSNQTLWLPNIAQVRNPRLIKALVSHLKSVGVNFESNNPVLHFDFESDRVVGVTTKHGCRAANTVVVTSGAWSGDLMSDTALNLPVEPIRGQMIALQAEPELIHSILMKDFRYLIPRQDGLVVVGSTIERVGFEKQTTEETKASLRQTAIELVPALVDAPVTHHWAGLRPAAPGGIPFIGAHPDVANLYINTGHFRNGINLAPASARLLVDLIEQRSSTFDPTPYALQRGGRC